MTQSINEVPSWVPVRQNTDEHPWFKILKLAISDDGLNFEKTHRILVDCGDTSNFCRDAEGRIILIFKWFSFRQEKDFGKFATLVSLDEGETWDGPRCLNMDGVRSGDPSMVLLDDGRLRIYSNSGIRSETDSRRKLGLISLVSSDGIDFKLEEGYRYIQEITGDPLCPTVIKIGEEWHYYIPRNNEHALSSNGLNFKGVGNIDLPEGTMMLGGATTIDGGYRFYLTTSKRAEGRLMVTSAFSKDGYKWTMDPGVRVENAADPGIIKLRNGKYLMSYSVKRFSGIRI